MYQKSDVCDKIHTIFPDVGECGKDIKVEYESGKKAWAVDLKKGDKSFKTYVDPEDIDTCLIGGKCFGLGFMVSQLRSYYK